MGSKEAKPSSIRISRNGSEGIQTGHEIASLVARDLGLDDPVILGVFYPGRKSPQQHIYKSTAMINGVRPDPDVVIVEGRKVFIINLKEPVGLTLVQRMREDLKSLLG